MKQSFTLKSFLVILFLLSGLKLQAALSKEIYVETAGTISSFISNEEKNLITNLTVTGNLNGTDLRYIRELAGTSVLGGVYPGQLTALDLSGADIVPVYPPSLSPTVSLPLVLMPLRVVSA